MGLQMSERKSVAREIKREYRKAGKNGKTVMLDQFIKLTGYNRKYAIRLLSKKADIQAVVTADGKTVVFKPEKKVRPKNRLGKPVYTRETVGTLEKIWAFYGGKCGAYLSVIIRQNIDALVSSREPDFHITPEIRSQLLRISGRQIDRVLKPVKDSECLHGISGTKTARETLLKQIPVRTHYSEDEAKTPGFCQTDTVHHCGDRDSGQFNLTLTITDVFSGWIWLFGLLNKAHCWTLEKLQLAYRTSIFKILELLSDGVSVFINHETIDWWKLTKNLLFTHSRSYHKNDNCYAEQKNNAFVRNYVGYWRYDTEKELAALNRVYEFLCPLVNFFIPNKKLLSKTREGSKIIKIYDKELKTPYRRLLESDLPREIKDDLTAARSALNPVELQYNLNKAVDNLWSIHKSKVTFS
jgi:hypothetical protein